MDEPLQFSYSPVFNDPSTKLNSSQRFKYHNWNEFQKLSKFNPIEFKHENLNDNSKLVRLTGVKHSIYNPRLPTLRSIDRNDTLCKLTDEHVRHTTHLPSGTIKKSFYMSLKIREN
jgi:hypothetical protein